MNDRRDDEQFDELMRRALSEEAGRIEPADGLHEIQARVRDQRKPVSRRPWAITAGAAVVGAAAAVGAFAVLNGTSNNAEEPGIAGSTQPTTGAPAVTSAGPSTPAPTLPASPVPLPTEASKRPSSRPTTSRGVEEPAVKNPTAVPVYWLGKAVGVKKGPSYRLYRTFARVQGRPALEAVQLMTNPKVAGDPDYDSPWAGATVSSVRYSGDLIMVDFDQLPDSRLDQDVADMAAQQLVYTVQGALKQASTPVLVTERGRAPSSLFGVLDASKPLSRAQTSDVQALVWIVSPENGETVGRAVTVNGIAAAFEAQVDWRATNLKTREVVKDYTSTSEGNKLSPYTFTAKLGSGEWLLEVYLMSPEDGRITDTDSKTIYVK